jgi:hypothetical protein
MGTQYWTMLSGTGSHSLLRRVSGLQHRPFHLVQHIPTALAEPLV